jgi:hypothetical protein
MGWEKRGKRTYYYRSVREGSRVKKHYYGTGVLGHLAASAAASRRSEAHAVKETEREQRRRLDAVQDLTREFIKACTLLTTAAMLAAGFHRPTRKEWRVWRHGRQFLKNG